jgi:hypothetical protein
LVVLSRQVTSLEIILRAYFLSLRQPVAGWPSLFDWPTALEGDSGIADWLRMFCVSYPRDQAGESAGEKIRQLAVHLRFGRLTTAACEFWQ